MTDHEKASSYLKHLETKFPEGFGLKYLLLDAWYDDDDEVEKKAFDQGMDDLWTMIASAPNLPTDRMKTAETKSKQMEKALQEMKKRYEEEKKKLEEARKKKKKWYEKIF